MNEINNFLEQIINGQLILSPNTPYSIKQLEAFIVSGKSLAEIYGVGVPFEYHNELNEFYEVVSREQSDWESTESNAESEENKITNATSVGKRISFLSKAIQYYQSFLNRWENNEQYYNSKHLDKAQIEIDRINTVINRLKRDIYDVIYSDMEKRPYVYKPNVMKQLLHGIRQNDILTSNEDCEELSKEEKIINEFLINGFTINIDELKRRKIIPNDFTERNLTDPDYELRQPQITELGEYPKGRTDVYFLGVPRSGKSSALAGIVYTIQQNNAAEYIPQVVNGVDATNKYKNGLIKSVMLKKCPVGTDNDAICFFKYDLHKSYTNCFGITKNVKIPINFVEMSGEAVEKMGEGFADMEVKKVWETRGARTCLESPNDKVLFIIIDYAVTKGITTEYKGGPADQQQLLQDIITYFNFNGHGDKNKIGCTMSKIKTVAFIMTKCDLMEDKKWSRRRDIAEKYIEDEFQSVVGLLDKASEIYGVNVRDRNGRINIIPFSLGDFYIGNTYNFDKYDSENVIKFLRETLNS